jgi:hypothetical protein
MTYKTYTNGNREIAINQRDGVFYVGSNVYDGTKWQYGQQKRYKTLKAAEKAATKHVSNISEGWTKNPTWTIETN